MKPKTSSLLLAVVVLGFSSTALAEDNGAVPEPVDNIEVTAKYQNMSLGKLRRELNRSAEDFYDTYNDLNDIDDFHVRCSMERPTGSRIRNHVCKAKFIEKAETKHAERNWDNRLAASNKSVETTGFDERIAEFEQHMSALVQGSPLLKQKLDRYNMMIGIVANRLNIQASQ
ncbi:MAG: hypothetical protein AAGA33_00110 [Pseudomonadota bacterium]